MDYEEISKGVQQMGENVWYAYRQWYCTHGVEIRVRERRTCLKMQLVIEKKDFDLII